MPYASNDALPPAVRGALPAAAQTIFRGVVNGRLAAGQSESRSHRQGWAVVHRSFEKPKGGGQWTPKDTSKTFQAPAYQQPANQEGSVATAKKATKAPMYGCRYLHNTKQFIDWAKAQGFSTTLEPKDLHATIAYSREPMEWPTPRRTGLIVRGAKGRQVARLGDKGAVVLHFDSPTLSKRWQQLRDAGASWDHGDGYRPHLTISYRVPEGFNLDAVKPYTGPLVFGPEKFKPIEQDQEHVEKMREIKQEVRKAISFKEVLTLSAAPAPVTYYHCDLLKFAKDKSKDKDLGLVFGWAIVSSENGEPYYDTQGDHIPDDSMLRAATEFMLSRRTMKIMHSGKQVGKVVFAWPMTPDIAEAMGIQGGRTGLMIAVKPDNPNVLARFRDGKYTGFSIGGNRLIDEDGDVVTSKALAKRLRALLKYDPNQARDDKGQWTAGGVARAVGGAALGVGALAAAAAAGHPLSRRVLNVVRTGTKPGTASSPATRVGLGDKLRSAVIGARTRAARVASKPGAVASRVDPKNRPYQSGDIRDGWTLFGRGSNSSAPIRDYLGAAGRQARRDIGHTSNQAAAAMRGSLSARGHERSMTNATRHQLNQFSAATRRRQGAAAGGVYRPARS